MTIGTTVGNLVDRVRRDSLLGSRGPVYTLAADPGASGLLLTFNEAIEHIGPGSLLAVNGEMCYVQSTNAASKQATVVRGYFGSTATTHVIGSVVEIDPRFPKAALVDHAQREIQAWGNELWRTTVLDVAVTPNERAYNLNVTGEVYFLLDVRLEPVGTGAQMTWGNIWTGDAWVHAEAMLVRGMDAGDFASTFALQLMQFPRRTTTARVALAQPLDLDPFVLTTDLVADVGLEQPWIEIVELGVRQRALSSSAVARTDWRSAGMTRDADQATTFDLLRAVSVAEDMRGGLLAKASRDLRARWPYRRG